MPNSTRTTARDNAPRAAELRTRAEERLRSKVGPQGKISAAEMKKIIHELHVYQIELEMQNEQLVITQMDLEKAREKYVHLYDYAPVGYLTIDLNGLIRQANLTGVEMLGLDRRLLLLKPFSLFVVKEDQESYYLCWRKVLQSPDIQVCEVRLRPHRAEPFHARLEMVLTKEDGKDICQLAFSNINAQKRAEEDLRKSQLLQAQYEANEWKQLALEAARLGACDQDLRRGEVVFSEHARRMLGIPNDGESKWAAFLQRIYPADHAQFLLEIDKSTDPAGKRRCDYAFRIGLPGGTIRWVRLVASTLFDGKRPVRRIGILQDITPLKEAEEVLKSRTQQLDVMVHERTAQLQEAMGDLEHMSYTLVHDLRAPLRGITGYMDLLLTQLQNSVTPAQKTFMQRSHAAALRMDNLLLDALSYNKISQGMLVLNPVDWAALLRQLIETYPRFHEARASILLEGSFPPVLGNPSLLTQCFSNLLDNALKFVDPSKTPLVQVSAQEKQGRVRICFQDNGIGISAEGKDRIFKLFQRLNEDYEGTGIGLALVKKAVERMGGTTGVESKPGKGSRFWLELQKADTL